MKLLLIGSHVAAIIKEGQVGQHTTTISYIEVYDKRKHAGVPDKEGMIELVGTIHNRQDISIVDVSEDDLTAEVRGAAAANGLSVNGPGKLVVSVKYKEHKIDMDAHKQDRKDLVLALKRGDAESAKLLKTKMNKRVKDKTEKNNNSKQEIK